MSERAVITSPARLQREVKAAESRNRSLIRVLTLLRWCLAGRRDTLKGFASQSGVCCRTVRRDFYVLEAVGFAVCRAPESGEGKVGTWWIERQPGQRLLEGEGEVRQ